MAKISIYNLDDIAFDLPIDLVDPWGNGSSLHQLPPGGFFSGDCVSAAGYILADEFEYVLLVTRTGTTSLGRVDASSPDLSNLIEAFWMGFLLCFTAFVFRWMLKLLSRTGKDPKHWED